MDIDSTRRSNEATRGSLLALDAALAGEIPPDRLDLARRALSVEIINLKPGPWDYADAPTDCFGYIIGDGFLIREVRLMGSRSIEPLGSGDLIRPWEEEAVSFAVAAEPHRRLGRPVSSLVPTPYPSLRRARG